MKKTLVLASFLFSFSSYAQVNGLLKLDGVRFDLETKCKENEGSFRFENLSAKIGESSHSVCYRYSCDVEKSYADLSYKICPQDKNSTVLTNIQKACKSLTDHKESKEGNCMVGSCLIGEKVKTDGHQIALNDVQVICLDNDQLSPAVVDDLRKWGKAVPEADNTRVQKPNFQRVKKQ
ncbi:MAG: hypothetical protein ACOVP4_12590 [Bacteriovoracaceae bacterium]|jgi:hypothetical protein